MVFEILIFAVAVILFMVICVNDFLFFRIENSVVVGVIVYYCLLLISGKMECSILYSISIASFLFVVSLILNHFDLLGGGDVKLLFGIGLLIPSRLFEFFCALSIMSMLMIFMYSFCNKKIGKIRAYYAIKVFRLKNQFIKKICFPSVMEITRGELMKDLKFLKHNNSILKQEIPYGVILSIGSITSIGSMLLGK